MSDDTTLRIELKNGSPVEASDYGAALSALADEYREFVLEECPDAVATDVRLYLKELKTGSVIADLIALAPLALPFVENANTVSSFAEHMTRTLQALLNRRPNAHLPTRTLANIVKLVEPVAKDNAAQLNVQTVIHNQTINNYITINSVESNAVQNAARTQMERRTTSATGVHRKVVLYLHQARNDPKSRAGDRGRIESIYSGAVKLIFQEEALKASILEGDGNPFKSAYLVDVEVETVRGRPVVFKVIDVHERLHLTGEPDAA